MNKQIVYKVVHNKTVYLDICYKRAQDKYNNLLKQLNKNDELMLIASSHDIFTNTKNDKIIARFTY